MNGARNGTTGSILIMKNILKSPEVNNIIYSIDNPNDTIQKTLLEGKQWNNWCFKTVKQLQETYNLKNLLNVGSHIGSVSLPLSFYFNSIKCVEPFPPTYSLLEENVKFNNLKNVEIFNFALGNEEGEIYFLDSEDERLKNNSGGMHCLTKDDIKNNRKSSYLISKKYSSKIKRLDETNIENFDIIIIDAEGTEYDLLSGGIEKIKKYKPIIITEIWNNQKRQEENLSTTKEDVFDLLYSLGYVYDNLGKERKNDFCFLPKSA